MSAEPTGDTPIQQWLVLAKAALARGLPNDRNWVDNGRRALPN